ncbi:MAG: rhodanese-like domain-containing protein [bacterium]
MVVEVTPGTLFAKIENGERFKLVDVSAPEDFAAGHIMGAIHTSLDKLVPTAVQRFRRFQQYDKNKKHSCHTRTRGRPTLSHRFVLARGSPHTPGAHR